MLWFVWSSPPHAQGVSGEGRQKRTRHKGATPPEAGTRTPQPEDQEPLPRTERDLPYILSLPPVSGGQDGGTEIVGLLLHLHGSTCRGRSAEEFMDKSTLLWALGDGWRASPWRGSGIAVVSPISPRERGLEWRTPWLRHAVMALCATVAAELGVSDRVAVIGHSYGGLGA